jgi:hypothetical protein
MQRLFAILFATVFLLGSFSSSSLLAQLPPTSLQIIHNAPDPAVSDVGVWVGLPTGTFLPAVPSIRFQNATPTLTSLGTAVPALAAAVGVPLTVNITRPNAESSSPALASQRLTLSSGANIVIATGVLRPRLFSINPNGTETNFGLRQFIDRTTVTITAGTVRLLIFHGSPDAPRVDIVARGVGVLATASYGEGAFVNVPLGDYTIDVSPAGSSTVVASFSAPLQTLGLGGQRLTVLASGFLTNLLRMPNSNQSSAPFRLLAVPATPGTQPLLLPTTSLPMAPPPPTTLQIIHNAADPIANRVAIWVGIPGTTGTTFVQAVPDLAFRGATGTLTGIGTAVPSLGNAVDVPLTVNVTATTNTMATPAVGSFSNVRLGRGTNVIVASGVVTSGNFAVNPSGNSTGFRLLPFLDTTTTVGASSVRVLIVHNSTDAPRVDIVARGVGTLTTLSYGEGAFVTVPVGDYTIDVRVAGTRNVAASFSAPLRALGLGGQRLTVLASGFLNPAQNINGAAFALLAVPSTPSATPLLLPSVASPLAPSQTTLQVIHNAADPAVSRVDVWLSTFTNSLSVRAISGLEFRTATPALTSIGTRIPFLSDLINTSLIASITTPGSSTATQNSLASSIVSVNSGANIIIASGVLRPRLLLPNPNGIATDLQLFQFTDRPTLMPISTGTVRLLIFHGATDAPRVDIVARGVGRLATASYGQGAFITVPLGDYTLDVLVAGTQTVVASFLAPLRSLNLGGQRVTVSASGVLASLNNQNQGAKSFELLAVVNSSATPVTALLLPRAPATSVTSGSISTITVSPNPTVTDTQISYTLEESGAVDVSVFNALGSPVTTLEAASSKAAGTHTVNFNTQGLQSGSYEVRVRNQTGVKTTRLVITR